MSKNKIKLEIDAYKVGHFTKNAIEKFEENIINKHNFLEEVDKNLKNKDSK